MKRNLNTARTVSNKTPKPYVKSSCSAAVVADSNDLYDHEEAFFEDSSTVPSPPYSPTVLGSGGGLKSPQSNAMKRVVELFDGFTPMKEANDKKKFTIVYYLDVPIAMVAGSKIAWEEKHLFPVFRPWKQDDKFKFGWSKAIVFGFLDIPDGIAIPREKKLKAFANVVSHLLEKDSSYWSEIIDIEEDDVTCEALRTALRGGSAGLYFDEAELKKVVGNNI
jgi:hypothetical protein